MAAPKAPEAHSSPRRIGSPEAKNRIVLLDAAEGLMLADGYAAVTSRKVAEAAGLKPQLVHYYFRTMDELFAAVFRRRAEEGLLAQQLALASEQPLWNLWRFGTDPAGTRLTMEIMGLANHRKALRSEIAEYAERFRAQETQAFAAGLARYGLTEDEVPPVVWAVFTTSIARVLVMEQELGMSCGHAETLAFVDTWLRRLEGDPLPMPDFAAMMAAMAEGEAPN